MEFKVIRPFRDLDGTVKMPGCTLEIEFVRASQLRRLGLIGQVAPERAVIMPQEKAVPAEREKAVRSPGETRRGRKPKEQKIAPPESVEENTENGVETRHRTGD